VTAGIKQLVSNNALSWLRYTLIAAAVLGFYGSEFFYFISEPIFGWLQGVSNWMLIPLFLLSLEALFRLRWKWISIFFITWMLLFLSNLGVEAPVHWLSGQGFHAHTLLDGNYLSKCRRNDFLDEEGGQQTVGFCEQVDHGWFCDYIAYDPAAQFALAPGQRTQKWQRAISEASSGLLGSQDGALHLYGNFYRVTTYSRGPGC
jgi:hypothetical protein